MKVTKCSSNSYKISSNGLSLVLTIELHEGKLDLEGIILNKNNLSFGSSFSIGNLVDIDKRFRAYEIEDVYKDIQYMIEKQNFIINSLEKNNLNFSYNLGNQIIILPLSSSREKETQSFSLSTNLKTTDTELQEENERLNELVISLQKKNKELEQIIKSFSPKSPKLSKSSKIPKEKPSEESLKGKKVKQNIKDVELVETETPIRSSKSMKMPSPRKMIKKEVQTKNTLTKMTLEIIKKDHSNIVNALCFLKDGRFATCSDDDKIKVFDPNTYECTLTLVGHSSSINYISTLENGLIVSGSSDDQIKIWEISETEYKCLKTLKGHTRGVLKVIKLSKNRICSCSDDKTIKIWSSTTYECIKTLYGHTDYIWSVIELKNKKYIVSGNGESDNTLRFWNNETYENEREINNVKCCGSNSLIELTNGKIVVGGSKIISVVNSTTFKVEKYIEIQEEGNIWSLIELSDFKILFGLSNGKIFHCSLKESKILGWKEDAHTKGVKGMCILKNDRLISFSEDKLIKIWK